MTRIDSGSQAAREALQSELARQQTSASERAGAVRRAEAGVPKVSDQLQAGTQRQLAHARAADAGLSLAGANPFAALAQGGACAFAPRLLARALGMTADVSPGTELLGELAALEGKSAALADAQAGLLLAATAKVREGMMLALSDAAELYGQESSVERGLLGHLGQLVHEDAKSEAKLSQSLHNALSQSRAMFPATMDVNAFVQAVLRESYLLQTEMMRDYAEKVKYYNALKKQMRDKLAKAREVRAGNHKAGDWVDFDFVRFDPHSGSWEEFALPQDESGASSRPASQQQPASPASSPLEGNYSAKLDGYFRHVPQEGLSKLAGMAQAIREDHAAGKKWPELFEHIKSDDVKLADVAQWMRDEARLLPPADFCTLVQTIIEHYTGVRDAKLGDGHKLKAVLDALLEHATGPQLDLLQKAPYYWGEATHISGVAYTVNPLTAYDRIFHQLPPALREGDLASFGSLLASELARGDGSALTMLKSELWNLDPEKARTFFAAIAEDPEKYHFDELFGAAFGQRILADANPSAWSFMQNVGGKAGELYQCWMGTVPEGRASTKAPLTLDALRGQGYSHVRGKPVALEAERLVVPAVTGRLGEGATGEIATSLAAGGHRYSDEALDAYIKQAEEDLQSVGDDAQLANVDLQNALQKQQQTLQMMSNISKMLHDTAMSIIRKMGS